MFYNEQLQGVRRILKQVFTSCMHTASGLALFYIQSCVALERTAFALYHFSMWFQLHEPLTWFPFLFDHVCRYVCL